MREKKAGRRKREMDKSKRKSKMLKRKLFEVLCWPAH